MVTEKRVSWALVAGVASVLVVGCGDRGTVVYEGDRDDTELTTLAYDPERVDTVRGQIVRIDPFQRIGRSHSGVRILLRGEGRTYYVYLGPARFLESEGVELEVGQSVRVEGSVLDGDGRRVIIARKLEIGDTSVLVRDREGRPQWRRWGRPLS